MLKGLVIEESFKFQEHNFILAAIVYFQAMHYTTHILGIQHPKLQPERIDRWFYHEGMKIGTLKKSFTNGLLFENKPKLEMDLNSDCLKPYILIYRVSI